MLFAIDIGNSNIVAGVFKALRLKHCWRMETRRRESVPQMKAQWRELFKQTGIPLSQIEGIVASTVVPALKQPFDKICQQLFHQEVLWVDHHLNLGITVKTDDPSEVGADRLVNATAAWNRVRGAVLVLDMGTAITVDAINQKGEYLGGVIAPGVSVASEALVRRAAKIPRVKLEKPLKALGSNTVDSIRSGIYHGTVGQVKELLKQCARGLSAKPVIIATGGWAQWVPLKQLGVQVVDLDLTLKGLRLIYQRNRRKQIGRKKNI